MKNHIMLLLICILIGCSNGNEIQPITNNEINLNQPVQMVSESNRWYMHGEVGDVDYINNIVETRKRKLIYYFKGDTLINDLQYKKMYHKQFDSIFHQPLSGGIPEFISIFNNVKYIAAMRQDDDVVHYISENQNAEDLYADFNLNIGDVLNYKWGYEGVIVTAIDSFPIGSNYISRYRLSNEHYFYEGIGSSFGLFNTWQTNASVGEFLTCFKLKDDKIEIDDGFYAPMNYCPEF